MLVASVGKIKIAVIGAGFSGAVVARELAESGYSVDVYEARQHIAGNCYTERDRETGVMVHTYGPHIFHTDNEQVWNYVNRFGEFVPFINRVKAQTGGKIFTLPINLLTINQFFGKSFGPSEAKLFLKGLGDSTIKDPTSFEEQALHFLGRELYEAFFKGYTEKQWGVNPALLPASILKRLPVRFTYEDNYYNHQYQGMPRHGYGNLIEGMLDHPRIHLGLGQRFSRDQRMDYGHTFYSGPIDAWFGYDDGRLPYRTLDFENHRSAGDFQGCAVMNYCDRTVDFTRITEHKYFAPWESHNDTLYTREYSRLCNEDDIPFYPVRLPGQLDLLQGYVKRAELESRVTFMGRLGTFRYLDMDVTIAEALSVARRYIDSFSESGAAPIFSANPIYD